MHSEYSIIIISLAPGVCGSNFKSVILKRLNQNISPVTRSESILALEWRHNGLDSVSNHQPHHCLLSHLFGRRSKKTSKLRVTSLCAGNSPGSGEFPAQMTSYAENVSIWWRHHVVKTTEPHQTDFSICSGNGLVPAGPLWWRNTGVMGSQITENTTLFNRLFGLVARKTSKLRLSRRWDPGRKEYLWGWPVDPPHKGPVMRRASACHGII